MLIKIDNNNSARCARNTRHRMMTMYDDEI